MNQQKAIELFLDAEGHNWDEGNKKLHDILNKPDCDLGTVSLIYWRAQPEYYLQYESTDECAKTSPEEYSLISRAEEIILSNKRTCIIEFDPASEGAGKSKPKNPLRELPSQVYEVTKGEIKATDILTGKIGPGVLTNAARANNLAKLKTLVTETTDAKTINTLLMVATQGEALDVMKYLISNGADLGARHTDNERVLHRACSIETVSLLLEAGAKLSLKSWHGTPLHYAADDKWNSYDDGVLELFLEKGANPNLKNSNGETPLHSAASGGRIDNLHFLIEAGGKLDSVDKKGRTVLHSAVDFPGWNHIHRINRGPMVAELLKLGVSADTEDLSGQNARMLATQKAQSNQLGELEKDQIIDLLGLVVTDVDEMHRLGQLATEHRNNNDHLAEIEILKKLLQEDKREDMLEEYQFQMAKAYAQIPKPDKALEAVTESLKNYDEFDYKYYRKLDVLVLLGEQDKADEILVKMLKQSDINIHENELAGTDDPQQVGPTKGFKLHQEKARLQSQYARDFMSASQTLQQAFDKKIYHQRGKTNLLAEIHLLKNNVDPIGRYGPFMRMIGAILTNDFNEIEDCRDIIKSEHVPDIVKTWSPDLSWDIKNGYIYLLLDQNSEIIDPIMEDGLDSPMEENRASALMKLSRDSITWEDIKNPDQLESAIDDFRKNR